MSQSWSGGFPGADHLGGGLMRGDGLPPGSAQHPIPWNFPDLGQQTLPMEPQTAGAIPCHLRRFHGHGLLAPLGAPPPPAPTPWLAAPSAPEALMGSEAPRALDQTPAPASLWLWVPWLQLRAQKPHSAGGGHQPLLLKLKALSEPWSRVRAGGT